MKLEPSISKPRRPAPGAPLSSLLRKLRPGRARRKFRDELPGTFREAIPAVPVALAFALALVSLGCGGKSGGPVGNGGKPDPGVAVTPRLPAASQAQLDQIQAQIHAASDGLDGAALRARHAVPFAALGYDPLGALGLDRIEASALALSPAERDVFARNGFVISAARSFPEFSYGYATIYSEHLPVYVSADSILHAVHKSYDRILAGIETAGLIASLQTLLDHMRTRLSAGAAGAFGHETEADVDLYLAVARSLLDTSGTAAPVAGASATAINQLVEAARAATGSREVSLFGSMAEMDFSQFTPRGHYGDTPELGRYFRTMIWLGRTELPILEPQGQSMLLKRRALSGALAFSALMDADAQAAWTRLDTVIHAFVGEPDSMSPADVPGLLSDLGAADGPALLALSDDAITAAIVAGRYGAQRIASQIVIAGPHAGTIPLPASFLLMGQRYVVDSHVFSNVTYDRVNVGGAEPRMLPNPLDAAYAALGNDQAAGMLASDLDRFRYAPDLESMRVLVGAHGDGFWDANLYNIWLSALRALSPSAATLGATGREGLPAIAATEAWGRRILSAQLASWAELRHDTILYVKQSYSVGVVCEFPDAYVDPYPELFARIGAFARAGGALVPSLGLEARLGADVTTYFAHLADVAEILRQMAANQRTGAAHTAAHLEFINQTVQVQQICGGATSAGWYPRLFFSPSDATLSDPTIADVHTAPTDAAGDPVGWVLHVATGLPRLFVTTADTCVGPRAYVGMVSAYHEKLTTGLDRMTDKRWQMEIGQTPPADVGWMTDLVAR